MQKWWCESLWRTSHVFSTTLSWGGKWGEEGKTTPQGRKAAKRRRQMVPWPLGEGQVLIWSWQFSLSLFFCKDQRCCCAAACPRFLCVDLRELDWNTQFWKQRPRVGCLHIWPLEWPNVISPWKHKRNLKWSGNSLLFIRCSTCLVLMLFCGG